MYEFNLFIAVFGGILLLLGLSSGVIKNRLSISEPIICIGAGILVGPEVLDLFAVSDWGNQTLIIEEVARMTLALALISVAFQLPDRFLFRSWKTLAVLLGLVMPFMWIVSSLLSWWILEVGAATAFLIGAVVTPTDPVVAASIVSGKVAEENLSDEVRFTISGESGANDALAYPIVMLMILIQKHPVSEAMKEWLLHTLGWKIGGAVVLGILIGYGSGRLLNYIQGRHDTDQTTLLTVGISLAIAVTGGVKLMNSEGLLAVFVAGIIMNSVITGDFEAEKNQINEAAKRFFDVPVFVLFGMALPWSAWMQLGHAGLLLAAGVLLFRRLPAILLTFPLMENIGSRLEAMFVGWFGPIGVAALYYAMLSLSEKMDPIVWHAGSLIIFASILIHGVTATPLTRLVARRVIRRISFLNPS